MKAFIVATPLQLFNSLVIMRHFYEGEKCDLFVLNIACDMRPVISRFHALNMIDSVYYLDDVCQHQSRLGIIWDHIYITKIQRRILSEARNKDYTDLFTTWVGRTSTWLYTKLSKNKKLNIHFYEEGIGVYIAEIKSLYGYIKLMYKILGYKFDVDNAKDLYLYQPSLCRNVNSNLKLVKIGDVTEGDVSFFNLAINSNNINPYSTKSLFLENDFTNTVFEGIDETLIIDTIALTIGVYDVAIRLHPRTSNNKYDRNKYLLDSNTDISWENLLALEKSIENVVLITTVSTAVLSPKIIYGREPKVIILGLAIKNEFPDKEWAKHFWTNSYRDFILAFKDLYNDKSLVMIPENFEEMKMILKKWCD